MYQGCFLLWAIAVTCVKSSTSNGKNIIYDLVQVMIWFQNRRKGRRKKRIFYGQTDRKGVGGGGLLQMIIWRAVAVIEGITDSGSWVKIAFSLCKIRFRTHLGQIPQDVGNGQYVAFFKFFEALL